MKQAYLTSPGMAEFTAAREQFGHLLKTLRSGDTLSMEHGDVEQLLAKEGNELLRRLLQGHLDLRTPEAILGLDERGDEPLPPRACNKRVWASVAREPGVIINELFAEAQARDPRHQRPWAVLGSQSGSIPVGVLQEHILKYCAARPDAVFPSVTVRRCIWRCRHGILRGLGLPELAAR